MFNDFDILQIFFFTENIQINIIIFTKSSLFIDYN